MTKGKKIAIVFSVVAILTTGIILFTATSSMAADTKTPFYFPGFSPEHIEVQRRIDWMLGDGFTTTFTVNGGFGAANGFVYKTDQSDDNRYTDMFDQLGKHGYSLPGNIHGNDDKIWWVKKWIKEGGITEAGGWGADEALHYSSLPEAMQDFFKTATDGKNFKPAINPGDTWQAYQYPSREVVAKYGNNLPYFIRCAPENLGCKLFHHDVSTKQVIIVVAGVVVTVLTAGSAAPIIAAAIAGGASLALKPGDDKAKIAAQASDYLKNNPDAFNKVPASSSFDGTPVEQLRFAGATAYGDNNIVNKDLA